jgi:hypothetical protein
MCHHSNCSEFVIEAFGAQKLRPEISLVDIERSHGLRLQKSLLIGYLDEFLVQQLLRLSDSFGIF